MIEEDYLEIVDILKHEAKKRSIKGFNIRHSFNEVREILIKSNIIEMARFPIEQEDKSKKHKQFKNYFLEGKEQEDGFYCINLVKNEL